MKITFQGKRSIRFVLDTIAEKLGNRKCRVCGDVIYEDNFGSVDQKGFICNKFTCLYTIKEKKIYE